MHVAFLTDVALPYVSGVTVAVRRQRDALREAGVTVTVVGPHGDVDIAEPDIHMPGTPAGHRLALFGPRLPLKLRSRNVELLHAHSVFGASWAALAAARRLRVPFVVTVHTRFDEYAHYAGLAAPIARTLVGPYTGAVVAAADVAIAPNEELAAELRAAGDARAVRVVPAPIDRRLTQGDPDRGRARLGVPAGGALPLSAARPPGGREGYASGLRMLLPPSLAAGLREGVELGTLVDELFGVKDSKTASGAIGLLTAGAVSRTDAFVDLVAMSLAPWIHPDHYR